MQRNTKLSRWLSAVRRAIRGMTERTAITETVQSRRRSFAEKRALPGQTPTWNRARSPTEVPTGRTVRNTGGSYGGRNRHRPRQIEWRRSKQNVQHTSGPGRWVQHHRGSGRAPDHRHLRGVTGNWRNRQQRRITRPDEAIETPTWNRARSPTEVPTGRTVRNTRGSYGGRNRRRPRQIEWRRSKQNVQHTSGPGRWVQHHRGSGRAPDHRHLRGVTGNLRNRQQRRITRPDEAIETRRGRKQWKVRL